MAKHAWVTSAVLDFTTDEWILASDKFAKFRTRLTNY